MASLFDRLCAACLSIFDSGKGDAVTSSQDGDQAAGPEQMGAEKQLGEDSDWRRAPGEYVLFTHSRSSRSPS